MRRPTPPRARSAAAWMLLVVAAASGCTICPDPFDYSGPVPNGSAPQNDFRARSNGIAPTGGVPRPWPPVVQAAPDATDAASPVVAVAATAPEPAQDEPASEAADGFAAGAVQPTAAEATDDSSDVDTTDVATPAPVTEPAIEVLLPVAPPRPEILPPLRETPGWRPRG